MKKVIVLIILFSSIAFSQQYKPAYRDSITSYIPTHGLTLDKLDIASKPAAPATNIFLNFLPGMLKRNSNNEVVFKDAVITQDMLAFAINSGYASASWVEANYWSKTTYPPANYPRLNSGNTFTAFNTFSGANQRTIFETQISYSWTTLTTDQSGGGTNISAIDLTGKGKNILIYLGINTSEITTISGGYDGRVVTLALKEGTLPSSLYFPDNGTGNVDLVGSCTIDQNNETLTIVYRADISKWIQQSKATN